MYACFRFKKLLSLIILLSIICALCGLVVQAVIPNKLKNYTDKKTSDAIFVPIIMYHSILNNSSRLGDFVISPETIENDFRYLKENGYTTILVQDLISYVYDNAELPDKPIIITFDDGFYNNITYALPLLKKYNMKAVVSVVGSYSQKFSEQDAHEVAYSYLTWQDITDMVNSGYFEIGNHTYNMHSISSRRGSTKKSGESMKEYSKALDNDILKLQNMLTEKSGVTPLTFAYPYGFISDESMPLLKLMGFKATLTCYEKPNYITKNPDCLFGLNRYNRAYGISTEKFMKKALSE